MKEKKLTTKKLNRRFDQLKQERQSKWDPMHKDLIKNIIPYRGKFAEDQPNDGSRKDYHILDSTPTEAAELLATGMQSGLTNPARPWFKTAVRDPDISGYYEVKAYFDEIDDRMSAVFRKSNLYNCLYNTYLEGGAIGTAGISIEEDYEKIINVRQHTVGTYYLATDGSGKVNTVARELSKTVYQVYEEFILQGHDRNGKPIEDWSCASESLKTKFKNEQYQEWIKIRHIIEPNINCDPDIPDSANMPFRSVYWEDGGDQDVFLRISGYQEFPFMFMRWNVNDTDAYGTGSPGWRVIGDCKQLQVYETDKAHAQDKMINPPINADANSRQFGINILPGGVNWSTDVNKGGVRPVYQINPDFAGIQNNIQDKRDIIKNAFFNNILAMMMNDNRSNVTAREVIERHEEKMLLLGPILQRVEHELLNPIIARTYNIMNRFGLLPEPPDILQGKDFDIQYISVLAQAQKMSKITPIEQGVAFVGNISAAIPSALDIIDTDTTIREYFDAIGVPTKVLQSPENVEAIRNQRAKQQQMAAMEQSAINAASGAKTLSEANTGTNNALTALLGGIPNG